MARDREERPVGDSLRQSVDRRLLFVGNDRAWPPTTGYRQRVAATIRALADVGRLDVVLVRPPDGFDRGDRDPLPPGVAVDRLLLVHATNRSSVAKALQWARSGQPWLMTSLDWDGCRTEVAAWAQGRSYDLAWFSRADAHGRLRDTVGAAHRCVDLENIESAKIAHRLGAGLDRWPAALAHRVDRRRWRRTESRLARGPDQVVVCSSLDAQRLPPAAATPLVFPNGAAGPLTSPVRQATDRPVMLFVGAIDYAPNADAVSYFADEVLPLVRFAVPDATFRVVGRQGGGARPDGEGVSVAGEVDDVAEELARAALLVAPIRFGGGTRIKILEAFAHGLPVVSTTVGCEGLDVVPGNHLVVADRAEDLAARCVELLLQPRCRAELAGAARQLWLDRYQWDVISAEVSRRVAALIEGSTEVVPGAPDRGV